MAQMALLQAFLRAYFELLFFHFCCVKRSIEMAIPAYLWLKDFRIKAPLTFTPQILMAPMDPMELSDSVFLVIRSLVYIPVGQMLVIFQGHRTRRWVAFALPTRR